MQIPCIKPCTSHAVLAGISLAYITIMPVVSDPIHSDLIHGTYAMPRPSRNQPCSPAADPASRC